jgi:hypothetical protein
MVVDPIYNGFPAGPTNDPFPGIKNIPCLIQEPDGFGEIGGRRRTEPSIAYDIGALARASNGTIFHHDENPSGNSLGPNQRQCAEAFFAGIRGEAMPAWLSGVPVVLGPARRRVRRRGPHRRVGSR